jgi:hypothetical protein
MNEAILAATWVAAALRLPAETWELLFELLLQDLPAENDPEIEAAWLAEVERRMRETDPSRLIPADEVFARVRASLSRPPSHRPPVEVDGLVLPVRDVIVACQALPADERLELAGSYLRRERASGESEHSALWLEDSARWLFAARAARRAGVLKDDEMGMFDVYEPVPGLTCPSCATPLREWQGKEGPRLCLVFRQGVPDAIGTALDGPPEYRTLHGDAVHLPAAFRIYSHDCPRHCPIYALCGSEEGVWTQTEIIPPGDDAE